MSSDPLRAIIGLAAFTLLGCYLLFYCSRNSGPTVRLLAFASVAIHAILGIVVWYGASSLIAPDARLYDSQAMGSIQRDAGKEGFPIVLGMLYRAIGHAPAAGIVMNAILTGLLVVVLARAAGKLGDERAAVMAAGMAVVVPSFVWWGLQLLREPAIWLALALAVDTALSIALDRLTFRRGAGMVVLLIVMLPLRAPIAAVIALPLGLSLLLARAPRPGDRFRRAAMIVGGAVLAVFLFPRMAALQSLETKDTASIVHTRNSLAKADTGFGDPTDATTTALVGQLPYTLPLVTFGPLPWQLPSSGLPAVADTLAWWFVLFWAIRGLGPLRRRFGRASWVLLIPAGALMVILALTLANFGIVIRMRAMVIVVLLPYAAVGLAAVGEVRARVPAFGVPREAALS